MIIMRILNNNNNNNNRQKMTIILGLDEDPFLIRSLKNCDCPTQKNPKEVKSEKLIRQMRPTSSAGPNF